MWVLKSTKNLKKLNLHWDHSNLIKSTETRWCSTGYLNIIVCLKYEYTNLIEFPTPACFSAFCVSNQLYLSFSEKIEAEADNNFHFKNNFIILMHCTVYYTAASIRFEHSSYTVRENDREVLIGLILSHPLSSDAPIPLRSVGDTATGELII